MEGANLEGTNLKSTRFLVDQLVRAVSLAGATLPDETKLSEENWEAEFEAWRRKQEARGRAARADAGSPP